MVRHSEIVRKERGFPGMNVILFQSVDNLGPQGSVVTVAPGYFRNFLSPRGLAVEATESNRKRLDRKIKQLEGKAKEELDAARGHADAIAQQVLTFKLRSGEGDKLFGSVTTANIADALAEKGIVIDRHNISIPEPIKRLGTFTVEAKVHHGVVAKIKVVVEREGGEVAPASEAAAPKAAEVVESEQKDA
jgi:large subunit ribosomal protein L9